MSKPNVPPIPELDHEELVIPGPMGEVTETERADLFKWVNKVETIELDGSYAKLADIVQACNERPWVPA